MSWNIKTPGDYINGPLTVAGTATITGALTANGSARFQASGSNWMEFNINVLASNQATGAYIRSVVTSAGNPTYSWTGDTDTGLFNDTANTIGFAVGGTPAMTLSSGGLEVVQSVSVRGANIVRLYNSDNTNQFQIYNSGATGASNANLIFLSGAVGERMRINPSGNLAFPTGKGIDFSAVTGGTGTATANVLNDYEEGTFTPTVIGTTADGTIGTYYAQSGRYTKVGRLVTVQVYLAWGSGTGATGDLAFAGLPFTNGSIVNNYASIAIGYFHDLALTALNVPSIYISPNSSRCDLYQFPVGGGGTTPVPYDVNGAIMFTATYFTA